MWRKCHPGKNTGSRFKEQDQVQEAPRRSQSRKRRTFEDGTCSEEELEQGQEFLEEARAGAGGFPKEVEQLQKSPDVADVAGVLKVLEQEQVNS